MLPIAAVVLYGIGGERSPADVLQGLLASRYVRARIGFTFVEALASTTATLVIGLPLAYLFAFRRFALKRTLRAAFTVPFVMPPLVLAIALQSLLGRGGWSHDLTGVSILQSVGAFWAILLAHVVYNTSLVIRIVGASWETVPTSLLEAASTLGASGKTILRRVLLPIAAPAISATALLTFLFCASSFGIILLLGGDTVGTLETLIYDEVGSIRAHYDAAALLGLAQLFTTLAAILLYTRVNRRVARFRPTARPRTTRPGIGGAAMLLAAAVILVGPFIALFSSAAIGQGGLGYGFRILISNRFPPGPYTIWDAVTNSTLFATLAIGLALPLALATAWALRNVKGPQRAWQGLFLLPLGTSAVLLALGILLVYDGTFMPDLRASPWRIVAAHVLIAFPFAERIVAPALDAITPRIQEAATTLGARPHQRFWRLDVPLATPALLAAAVFVAAVSLGEFGATLLLRRPEYTTLPLALYDAYSRPGLAFRAQAEAIASILAMVALAAFLLLEARRSRHGGELV